MTISISNTVGFGSSELRKSLGMFYSSVTVLNGVIVPRQMLSSLANEKEDTGFGLFRRNFQSRYMT